MGWMSAKKLLVYLDKAEVRLGSHNADQGIGFLLGIGFLPELDGVTLLLKTQVFNLGLLLHWPLVQPNAW